MKVLFALGLVALYAAGCLGACLTPTIDYFPKAEELAEGFAVNITLGYDRNDTLIELCNGTQNCNSAVWKSASQMAAATKAGVNLANGLLMVVPPRDFDSALYFKVSSPLLVASNTTFIEDCLQPTVTRKLLGTSVSNLTVKTAGNIEYTVKVDEANAIAGDVLGTAGGKLVVPKGSSAGEHCAVITVNINGFTLEDAAGTTDFNLSATATSVTSKKICWYKPEADKASAEVVIGTPTMCDSTLADSEMKININISNVTPSYLALQQHTTDLPKPLLQPVVHIFGRRTSALDGTTDTAPYDANTNNKNFVNQYILFPQDFTMASTLPVELDATELEEGFYNITAKVFVMSDFKQLLGVPTTNISQTEVDTVKGQVEIMTEDLFKNQKVALQKSLTILSAIESDKEGKAIKVGDDIEFSWNFVGAPSKQTCKHGPDAAVDCTSPWSVKAKDVSGDAQVTFLVDFTDVCGNKKQAEYQYSAAGVIAVTKVDTPVVGGGVVKPPGNASSAAAPFGFVVTIVMALMMAAFL